MSKTESEHDYSDYKRVVYSNYDKNAIEEMKRSLQDLIEKETEEDYVNENELIALPFKNKKILESWVYRDISKICELNGGFIAGSFARACIYGGTIEDNFHEDALCVDGEYSSNQFLPESTYISVGNFTSKSKTEFPRYAKKYTRKTQQAIDTLQSKLMKINRLCPSDIDIYCQSTESFELIKRGISSYTEEFRTLSELDIFEDTDKIPKENQNFNIEIENPIEIFDVVNTKRKMIFSPVVTKVQVINPEIASGYREDVLSKFDLDVCKFAILDDENIIATRSALKNELNSRITITAENVHSPIRTLYQIMKYARKGYIVGTFELMKLVCMIKKNVSDDKVYLINKFFDNYAARRREKNFQSYFYEDELDELYAIFDFS